LGGGLGANLPTPSGNHSWKFIAVGPDDLLDVPTGAPRSVCEPPPMAASILRMKPDGSDLEVFAEGMRKSVGFGWNPVTKELWFSDNGRDLARPVDVLQLADARSCISEDMGNRVRRVTYAR
jgi:glucose/arabinose dehydrogenase